jgi:UDP-N-acetylglucosamine 2-epimerase
MPDRDLEVGSASHAVQTGNVMIGFEQVCLEERPDLVVVVGDVNSTMAATLVAAKLLIPVAHVEAGLRSFDRTMPEEINRIVTDRLADLLLTPSPDGNDNLLREGVPARADSPGRQHHDRHADAAPAAGDARSHADRVRCDDSEYAVLTLHRPSNVDDPTLSRRILEAVATIARGDAGRVSGASANAGARERAFGSTPLLEKRDRDRAARLHRLSQPDVARALILSDSGGLAGRIDRARHSVPDAAREHRAAGHRDARHQPHRRHEDREHPVRVSRGDAHE